MSKLILNSAVLVSLLCSMAYAQDEESEFSPENAILDTSILFAIGAREAQQELRGAYGWPTFQEGLTEGVYFRFDPDGYARFSTAPRLDIDVFEVICRPGTIVCLGRKGTFSMQLNSTGALQIAIDGVSSVDELFIVDGITELPLPNRILQPLDTRLEALLSSGGELLVRHGATETARVSLSGFLAASTYLRWIASNQNDTAFPRGWPVPSSQNNPNTGALLTQVVDWESPLQQTQMMEITSQQSMNEQILAELQQQIQNLQDASQEVTIPKVEMEFPDEELQTESSSEFQILSERLNYLMTEIGMDSASALKLLQHGNIGPEEPASNEGENSIVDDILTEIRTQIPEIYLEIPPSETEETPEVDVALSEQEYRALTLYFKSVFREN